MTATAPALTLYRDGLNAALDDRDYAYLEAALIGRTSRDAEPEQGDVVRFADGVTRRISHVWPESVQTSERGSFHLFRSGFQSFSGSLHTAVPLDTLELTDETAQRRAWIFHHGIQRAHNGVTVAFPVYVWTSTALAPTY